MGQLEIIISIVATIVSSLSAIIAMAVKTIKAISSQKQLTLDAKLLDKLIDLVTEAESTDMDGTAKRIWVMRHAEEFVKGEGGSFDLNGVLERIDILVNLTKCVNCNASERASQSDEVTALDDTNQ